MSNKIYKLCIVKSEDVKKIYDHTRLYKDTLGYFSSIKNVESAIKKYAKTIKDDMDEFPEYIQKIYCDTMTLDLYYDDDETFGEGSLFLNYYRNKVFYKDKSIHNNINEFKIGDYVSLFNKRGEQLKVGVITHLPLEHDNTYTIYYGVDENDYMDHTHYEGNWLYKIEVTDKTLKEKLDLTLKKVINVG